ncbi:hypothetical protein BGX27_002145 [Mortierella sp. AM989]|nr:hypothetical protein BGX27_002145 [Mortierella sp. AM989]
MLLSSKTFISRFPAGVALDDDVLEYLSSVIDGQAFTTIESLREDTEHFLVDAGVKDTEKLNTFYSSFADQFSSTVPSSSPSTLVRIDKSMEDLTIQGKQGSSDSSDKEGSALAKNGDTKKPSKSKPVKMTKAAKKLAAKSSGAATPTGSQSPIVGNTDGDSAATSSGQLNNVLEAYSQQSRFHEETLETLSKEVDLKQVNIAIGDRPLLKDARLWFKSGTMYGLIGRNGTGKSTLLKAIGYGELIGFPLNLRTLYIEQLPSETPEDQTVLETVLKADTERTLLMTESKLLQEAMNKYPKQLVKCIKKLEWERSKVKLTAQQRLAIRRSGKRGADARELLLVVEVEEKEAQAAFEAIPITGVEPSLEVINHAHEMLENVFVQLQQIEADSAEARARELLRGLGFTPANQDLAIKSFSGGWKMRIALAQALFLKPDLLLLDEPTK